MSTAGLEHMIAGSVAKRLNLSRHTGRHVSRRMQFIKLVTSHVVLLYDFDRIITIH